MARKIISEEVLNLIKAKINAGDSCIRIASDLAVNVDYGRKLARKLTNRNFMYAELCSKIAKEASLEYLNTNGKKLKIIERDNLLTLNGICDILREQNKNNSPVTVCRAFKKWG